LQTYQMYQDGKTPQEIAVERDLALTTVYGHLSHYVETGDLPLTDFVSADKARVIRQAITQLGTRGDMVNTLKESLGNAYTYTDIRFVMATMHLYRK
jgi:ATP-dependent DNA helicase RecQ